MSIKLSPARSGGPLTAALIVIAASGCDNVEWGGATVDVRSPALPAGASDPEASSDVPAPPSLPDGEMLFLVSPDGDEASATGLAFVSDGQAQALPPLDNPRYGPLLEERLAGLRELTLFTEGTRAGTALVAGTATVDEACPARTRIPVGLELRTGLDLSRVYLAMPRGDNPMEHGPIDPPAQVRDVRASTLSMAGNIINEVGAVWPPSILGIRRDIRLFQGPAGLGVAASFLYRDQLDTSAPPAGSWSIFVMGEERPDSVHITYGDFRRSGTDGKEAPRFLARLDWDADGEDEVALELFGDGQRSFRLLERDGDAFVDALNVRCALPGGS